MESHGSLILVLADAAFLYFSRDNLRYKFNIGVTSHNYDVQMGCLHGWFSYTSTLSLTGRSAKIYNRNQPLRGRAYMSEVPTFNDR